MTGFLIFVGIAIGLFAMLLVAIFVVSMIETQYLREFVPMTVENEVAATPYLSAMAARASLHGYVHGGEMRHVKHPLRASTWSSPDRRTIAAVYGGHVAKMQSKKTKLFSRMTGGAIMVTTDEVDLPDRTGLQTRQLVMNGNFDELRTAHENWLAAAEALGGVTVFENSPPAELEAIDVETAQRMEEFGLVRIDHDAGTYRHTLKGAVVNTFSGFFAGIAESSKQAHRQNLPRPG